MADVRQAVFSDLGQILLLYRVGEVSASAQPAERAAEIWHETLDRQGVLVFVSEYEKKIVSSCMLITAPNLLREGRQHAFLENVVTHPQYQNKGHGTAVVRAALSAAWASNCYHVLMQSGRADPKVHRFYERLGFEPGLRVGYVAQRPQEMNS